MSERILGALRKLRYTNRRILYVYFTNTALGQRRADKKSDVQLSLLLTMR